MSVRELLRDRRVGLVVAGILILAAAAVAVVSLKPNVQMRDMSRAFYSDDDGQSYFKDSVFKFAPWDHDGKNAVEAIVYAEDGHNYVAYLQRYTPDAQKKLQAAYNANPDDLTKVRSVMMAAGKSGLEVKEPGPGHKWLPAYQFASLNLQAPGSDPPTLVMP